MLEEANQVAIIELGKFKTILMNPSKMELASSSPFYRFIAQFEPRNLLEEKH